MKIWMRVGLEMDVTSDEFKELKKGNDAPFRQKMEKGEYVLSGDAYLPDISGNGGYTENTEENYFELLL